MTTAALAPEILAGTLPDYLLELPEAQLLDLLDTAAAADVAEHREPNTVRAEAQDWAVWRRFTAGMGLDPVTVRSGLFYTFVRQLERQATPPSVVARRLSGVITRLRRDHGCNIPRRGGVAGSARERIGQYEVELIRANLKLGRGPATPVTADQLRAMCARPRVDLYELRAVAVVLLGFAVAARVSELINLLVSDIVVDPAGRGLVVTIRASKGGVTRIVPVGYDEDPAVCPVRAWLAWQSAAGVTGGPAFRQIRRCRDRGLSDVTLGKIITAMGHRADPGLHLVCHGLRAGRVVFLFEMGCTVEQVAAITGHSPSSRVIHDYNRPVDLWRNPAVTMTLTGNTRP